MSRLTRPPGRAHGSVCMQTMGRLGMSYERPATLAQALELMAAGPRVVLAGGTDLFAATDRRELAGDVLDIAALAALRGIDAGPAGVRIGGAATWTDVIRADLPPALDGLVAASREVGSIQIQNRGTVAGNLCNASPAADGVPALLTLGAEVELASMRGIRRLPLEAFLLGPRRTALAADELLVAVHLPPEACAGRGGFVKLGARRHLVISIGMCAARIEVAEGRVTRAVLAMGACGPAAVRMPEVEAALEGVATDKVAAAVTEAAASARLSPIDDIRADAGYRRRAAAELARRALAQALAVEAAAA